MSEDLLRPTIEREPGTKSPWRLTSQLFVAFFGGALAVTAIGFVNAGRLGVEASARRLILGVGATAFAAGLVIVALLPTTLNDSVIRLIMLAFALLAYAAQARLQRTHDRAFTLRGGEYASLWGPGFAAVIGCGIVQGIVVALTRNAA